MLGFLLLCKTHYKSINSEIYLRLQWTHLFLPCRNSLRFCFVLMMQCFHCLGSIQFSSLCFFRLTLVFLKVAGIQPVTWEEASQFSHHSNPCMSDVCVRFPHWTCLGFGYLVVRMAGFFQFDITWVSFNSNWSESQETSNQGNPGCSWSSECWGKVHKMRGRVEECSKPRWWKGTGYNTKNIWEQKGQ